MSWEDNTFEKADDPLTAGWMIMYWRIVPCYSGCEGNYQMESRQFDHLSTSATYEEAKAKLDFYVAQKIEGGKADSIKGLHLFLCEVKDVVQISDNAGDII